MQKIKVISSLMILSALIGCTSTQNLKKPEPILNLNLQKTAIVETKSFSSCEDVLEKCAKAVDAQKTTIESQQKVIVEQDKLISDLEVEVEKSHRDVERVTIGGVSVSSILLLLLLL